MKDITPRNGCGMKTKMMMTVIAARECVHDTTACSSRFQERERETDRQTQRERENSKTLFSKDCSLGSFRPV